MLYKHKLYACISYLSDTRLFTCLGLELVAWRVLCHFAKPRHGLSLEDMIYDRITIYGFAWSFLDVHPYGPFCLYELVIIGSSPKISYALLRGLFMYLVLQVRSKMFDNQCFVVVVSLIIKEMLFFHVNNAKNNPICFFNL